jgi:Fe-S-cluster containining protein
MSDNPQRVDIPLDEITAIEDDPLQRLERQVERASLYAHTAIGQNAIRLGDVEGFVFGLIDVLLAKKLVTSEEVEAAVAKVKTEMAKKKDYPSANVAMRVDPESADETPFVPVNCAERIHICKAVCCKLHFALSQGEIESGKVKWDLGQPYYIRQETNGFCTHNNRETGGCGIYPDRPRICRTYSCAHDERIWKDFENMELNHEWLEVHLNNPSQPRFVAAFMQIGNDNSDVTDTSS